jgi:hypothetical protein
MMPVNMLRLWHSEFSANLFGERVRSFVVSWNGLNLAVLWIAPKLVLLALALQKAAIPSKMPQQFSLFH